VGVVDLITSMGGTWWDGRGVGMMVARDDHNGGRSP
jgi:hypothetical protein